MTLKHSSLFFLRWGESSKHHPSAAGPAPVWPSFKLTISNETEFTFHSFLYSEMFKIILLKNLFFRRLRQSAGISSSLNDRVVGLNTASNDCVPATQTPAHQLSLDLRSQYYRNTGGKKKEEEGPPSSDFVVFINKLSFPFFNSHPCVVSDSPSLSFAPLCFSKLLRFHRWVCMCWIIKTPQRSDAHLTNS